MAKTKTTKRTTKTKEKSAGETEVSVCRRRSDRRGAKSTAKVESVEQSEDGCLDEEAEGTTEELVERRKVPRRRQIDPTTCERDYTNDEIEFMHALDAYKRSSGRMFPTCSEILEVVRGLGYTKVGIDGEISVESPQMDADPSELAEVGSGQSS